MKNSVNPLIAARDRFLVEHPEKKIAENGREWGSIRVGENGPALILIPGTLGRADIFFQQILALKSTARILALTYPSTGGIEDWAKDISDLITSFELQNAIVLGSSLGGYLAQYLAGIHGDGIAGIVAANTLPSVQGIDQVPPYSLDLDATPIEELRNGFSAGISTWITPENPYADLAEMLLKEVNGRIPEAELRTRLKALKYGPELPDVDTTSRSHFTVESGDDHLIPPEWQNAVRQRLNPACAYRFAKGSHFPYVTCPTEYSEMLKEMLGLEKFSENGPEGVEVLR